jgi:hypothetical protein
MLANTQIETVIAGYQKINNFWYGLTPEEKDILYTSELPNLFPMAYGVVLEMLQDKPSQKIIHPNLEIKEIYGLGFGFPYAYLLINM